ncbi:MAG: hypothetical protein PHW60_08955 [Kiritimatiellae bacterium]|nr:hypothetical protein [Kiritimatiellia bacterium]
MNKEEVRGQRKSGRALRLPFCLLPWHSSRSQALAEYVIIAGLLVASLGILTVFFVTFKEYGSRVLALVSSEYP